MRARRAVVLVGMVTALMMVAGPAFAHFCYVANRSPQGNANAAKSQAWVSIDELLAEEGVCEAGIAHFVEEFLAPRGLSGSTLLHEKALLAGPHLFSPKASDGKGIDHLFASPDDFDEIDQVFLEVEAICAEE